MAVKEPEGSNGSTGGTSGSGLGLADFSIRYPVTVLMLCLCPAGSGGHIPHPDPAGADPRYRLSRRLRACPLRQCHSGPGAGVDYPSHGGGAGNDSQRSAAGVPVFRQPGHDPDVFRLGQQRGLAAVGGPGQGGTGPVRASGRRGTGAGEQFQHHRLSHHQGPDFLRARPARLLRFPGCQDPNSTGAPPGSGRSRNQRSRPPGGQHLSSAGRHQALSHRRGPDVPAPWTAPTSTSPWVECRTAPLVTGPWPGAP